MPTTPVLDSTGATKALQDPLAPGRAAAASSKPVALSTEDKADLAAIRAGIEDTTTPSPIAKVFSAAATGLTRFRIASLATTNIAILKASAGRLSIVRVFNLAAYDVFLKFYNKTTTLDRSTDIPIWTLPLKAGAGFNDGDLSEYFSAGISLAITKNLVDNDATAIAARDVVGIISVA